MTHDSIEKEILLKIKKEAAELLLKNNDAESILCITVNHNSKKVNSFILYGDINSLAYGLYVGMKKDPHIKAMLKAALAAIEIDGYVDSKK